MRWLRLQTAISRAPAWAAMDQRVRLPTTRNLLQMNRLAREESRPLRRSLRILVADESSASRMLLSDTLAGWGIKPAFAVDGEQAVKIYQQWDFDLILMDIVMTGMGGIAAAVEIRRIERERASAASVPIVAYTTLHFGSDQSTIRRLGLNGVLPKPCSPASLQACLERWCTDKFVAEASSPSRTSMGATAT